jgi:hypothetical protein
MEATPRIRQRRAAVLTVVISLALGASPAVAETADDIFLLSTSVPPNVVLFIDNSNAMNQIEWHPAFDPTATPTCANWDNTTTYSSAGLGNNETACGRTRTIFKPVNPTMWDGRYLNWYFSLAANPYINEIENAEVTPASCNSAGSSNRFVDLYRRTRADAAKQVFLDVLCVAEPRGIRFGLGEFREADDVGNVDPNGGFMSVAIDDNTPAHASDLEAHVGNTQDVDSTPLAEAFFQIYSYLMPRDPAWSPKGADGLTPFMLWVYDKFGGVPGNAAQVLPDPVQQSCQKNFVVIVTTGLATRDDFDRDPLDTSLGFDLFPALVGDYNADGETERPGDPAESSYLLDDVVKFANDTDCRPDFDDDQNIDTYTIGLGTTPSDDAYLERVADLGNGLFFATQDGPGLAEALVAVLNDIIEKSRSFTAATVPSSRTANGASFYNSFFLPSGKSSFWEGHIRAWHFTASGDVLDRDGDCALVDPDPGECNSGPFKPICQLGQTVDCIDPFWDAGNEIPAPPWRTLWTSKLSSGTPTRVAFGNALTAADLNLSAFAAPPDPAPNSALYPIKGSSATNVDELAGEVMVYVRGCVFGTGVVNGGVTIPCEVRPWLLGDVFHSDPVLVRQPKYVERSTSYEAFSSAYASRTRVLYAGTNAGFLEAIHAGTWDSLDGAYDEGTGVELFGFMPWEARTKVKNQPIDSPRSRTHYVDGSPQASDVWFHPTATTAGKNANGSEWRTLLVGGLREGGHHYYALDITNPDGTVGPAGNLPYPGLLWEFPQENDPNGDGVMIGETWAQPVLTRVRLQVAADNNSGAGYERWVVLVTGGYDETGDPNPDTVNSSYTYVANGTRGRSILMLDAKTGEVLAEKKFDSGAGDATADMDYTIPSTPAVFDLNADGFADVVYVGDLGGNLWKWVIHPIGEDRVNDASGLRTQPNWPFKKFFSAPVIQKSGDDYFKNIFQPPAGALVGGQLWLAFGAGERSAIGFHGISATDENNRYYVMRDLNPLEQGTPLPTIVEADLTDATNLTSVSSSIGYYLIAADGEKFVTRTVIFGGDVIVGSFTPATDDPGDPLFDPCTSRGSANLYYFDLASGEGSHRDNSNNPIRAVSIGAGMPTDPKVSVGVGGKDNRVIIEKSGTDIESQEADDININGGILYWKERF